MCRYCNTSVASRCGFENYRALGGELAAFAGSVKLSGNEVFSLRRSLIVWISVMVLAPLVFNRVGAVPSPPAHDVSAWFGYGLGWKMAA